VKFIVPGTNPGKLTVKVGISDALYRTGQRDVNPARLPLFDRFHGLTVYYYWQFGDILQVLARVQAARA
jgi:hypothetical protein